MLAERTSTHLFSTMPTNLKWHFHFHNLKSLLTGVYIVRAHHMFNLYLWKDSEKNLFTRATFSIKHIPRLHFAEGRRVISEMRSKELFLCLWTQSSTHQISLRPPAPTQSHVVNTRTSRARQSIKQLMTNVLQPWDKNRGEKNVYCIACVSREMQNYLLINYTVIHPNYLMMMSAD